MPRVKVNGIDLHYVEAGTGDPLLMIMGFGGDHLAWAFQVLRIREEEKLLLRDEAYASYSTSVRHRLIPGVY